MNIDGWEVDEVEDRDFIAAHPDGMRACRSGDKLEVWDADDRYSYLPVRVARILLGGCDPEAAELLQAIAALTGTPVEDDGPSVAAWSQIRCSEVGQVAPGALPWRPAVGSECYYFMAGDWIQCRRLGDYLGGGMCEKYAPVELPSGIFHCDATYDGIRPLGSLPVPASVRTKAEGGVA